MFTSTFAHLCPLHPCCPLQVRDEGGALMNDFTGRVRLEDRKPPEGTVRTLVIALDPAQYQIDVDAHVRAQKAGGGGEDLYGTFNLLMRRKAKENNFKAVLESIRCVCNAVCRNAAASLHAATVHMAHISFSHLPCMAMMTCSVYWHQVQRSTIAAQNTAGLFLMRFDEHWLVANLPLHPPLPAAT